MCHTDGMREIREASELPRRIERIAVVGTTGCGKSTLARELARRMGAAYIELDALGWEDDWKRAPRDVIHERFARASAGGRWVSDGNFKPEEKLRDVVLNGADLVMWLDLPFRVVLWRIFSRSIRRAWTKEPLWGTNNRESFRLTFLSHDSVILWTIRTFRTRRRQYARLAQSEEFGLAGIVRIRSRRESRRWVEQIPVARNLEKQNH